eukprot:gnl/TRDRNA2_/TRDRNA2_90189_c0_seq1.p1 gnl/TRDRNA2_/TRDRNA2_90189_c0~~gnl/TRDRNA2_/TRDRNA2_90189_c0_seq1.p1  ORF type:complete len:526 (+),score=69.45 gnl/TRDRNA2_/TRDRNA2_90189_c0_seq1:222-1580(+)
MASFVFILSRSKMIARVDDEEDKKQDTLLRELDEIMTKFRLIADFHKRHQTVEVFQRSVSAYSQCKAASFMLAQNNQYFVVWLTTLSVVGYMFYGGEGLLNETLSLGIFLTDIYMLKILGREFGSIYTVFLEMQAAGPSLNHLVYLLNLPIDLPLRMELDRFRRRHTRTLRSEMGSRLRSARSGLGSANSRLDMMRIEVVQPEFEAVNGVTSSAIEAFRRGGKLEIEQGTFVALVGPLGEGKGMLLKLIGGAVQISMQMSGRCGVFVPSHLRVLHISLESMFRQDTLLRNLTYGVVLPRTETELSRSHDANPGRVRKICERLGLNGEVLDMLDSDNQWSWLEVLSHSQCRLLCIARGLIANPDVLCVHKPAYSLDEIHATKVLEILKEFVTKAGVEKISALEATRPRTCIITAHHVHGVNIADAAYRVSRNGGIEAIAPSLVTPETFASLNQ